ncbi:MAG: translocation/assembly module TamB domain-containing protein [Labilithrix sp.]|nr:translocation/assembly module TamB domain-containing protein [Labilithrix sp.]MCW5817739.1 translocation/assembly module TamB domain-containing protein [Labilithrix sp.]
MRRRALAVLAHGARGVALATLFSAAATGGIVLHANLAGGRRAAAEIGNRATASLFDGRVVIGEVERLAIGNKSSVRVRAAEVLDPDAKRVIHAEGIDATIDLRALLRSLSEGRGPAVELEDVRVATADVVLDRTPDGSVNVARAFAPRVKTKKLAPKPKDESMTRSDPYLDISSVRVGHAHVSGNLVPPSLDGDADGLKTRVHLEHDVVRVDLDEGTATLRAPHAPNQNQPITGAVKGALVVAIAAQPSVHLSGHADLTGAVGAVPLAFHAEIDGDTVSASVDVARVETEPLGKAFADLPFGRPVEAHVRAAGKLPSLALDVRARVGESDVVASGEIDVQKGHVLRLDAEAKHVDASAYGAPIATDITTKVHAEGAVGAGAGFVGSYEVTTESGSVGLENVPATTIEGKIEEQRITATISAKEPGVELSGTGELDLGSLVTTFDVQARSASLHELHRAPNVVRGAASVRARGEVDLRARTLDVATTLRGDGLAFGLFSAKHLDANGRLHGPLAAPLLDAGFGAKDLAVQAKDKQPLLYPAATGRAQIAFVPSVRIVSVSVDVGAEGDKDGFAATATNIDVANGVVEARGVSLKGLGEPLELDARVGRGAWSIRAKSAGVDLHRVAAMTGIRELTVLPEGTRAELDVDVHDSPAGATGHVDVVITSEKGALLGGGLMLETHAAIERGHLTGNARVSSEGLGWVEVKNAELDIPGRLDARAIERTTGVMELRGSIDLAQGGALLGGEHVERMAGVASFEARVERGDPDAPPAVRTTIKTTGLEVVYLEDPTKPSTTFAGIDLSGHLAWDGRTDDAEVALLSWDARGVLGAAAAKAKVPLLAWATGKAKIDRDALAKLEVDAVADVPSRDIRDIPSFIDIPDIRGKVGLHAIANGTLEHPSVVLSARADGIDAGGTRRSQGPPGPPGGPLGAANFEPLDAVLEARWTGEQGAITFAFDERTPKRRGAPPKRSPGHVHGLVMLADLRMRDLFYGRERGARPWSAAAELEIKDIDLGALPLPPSTLGPGRALSGALTGRFRVRDLNRDASLQGQAEIAGFGVGGASVESLELTVFGRDASLFVHAKATDKDSSATLQLSSQSAHIDGLAVSWNAEATSRLDYAVQNVDLALLGPLVRRQVSEIAGRVNGAGSIRLDGDEQVFEGGLALMGTNMYVNAVGEEVVGLTATARFDRSGRFVVDDATGKVGEGEFRARVHGRMKGFTFQEANLNLTSSGKEGLPISSDGASFGSVVGEVKVNAKMSADREALDVTIEVPRAAVSLPDRSTQQLEPLEPDPTIKIGVRRKGTLDTSAVRRNRGGSGRATTAAATATFVTKIDAQLGDNVRLQGRGLDVALGGRTLVQLANEVAITGQIDLKGGSIIVHGRRFTVDRGIVSFAPGGDPGNPSVVAAAYWDAPDRTRVWVEFAGPLKTGTLTLRSEPAFSKNEILSILLFGQPDPNMARGSGTAQKGSGAGATTIGTGLVASDLNRVLSEIDENLELETDTVGGNRTRTKVGRSFFDRRLKVQVGVAPGQTYYREPDTTFLFVNWQIVPKWSVVATAGNAGTSILDLLFQHRY